LPATQVSDVEPDYEIIFFPTVAHADAPGKTWELEIRGCVYENEKHRLALAILRDALALERVHLTKTEAGVFNERARLFMVDHKGGKKVVIELGNHALATAKTKADGEFSAVIRLSDADVQRLGPGPIEFHARLPAKDKRVFEGLGTFAPPSGLSVISDIDDTIKITQVRDYQAALKSTFLEPFQAVPGMAQVYQNWATNDGAQFYYVSASPWQLFLPLTDFLKSNGFPAGVFCLKEFRVTDRTRFSIFENPQKYKPGVIEPLFKTFSERKFVLVGDSGERDPEVYGDLARRFPGRVAHIFIRDVTGDAVQSPRYQQAFHDLPAGLWTVFHEPSEIGSVRLRPE